MDEYACLDAEGNEYPEHSENEYEDRNDYH